MPATQTDRIDGLTTSIAVKAPCRVASTAPIAFVGSAPRGFPTIDGVTVSDHSDDPHGLPDRVLLKDQADATQNGIWLVAALAWTRALDFDGSRDGVNGTLVPVVEGSQGGGTFWMAQCTEGEPIIFGTTEITFRAWPYSWGGGNRGTVTLHRLVVFRYDNAGVPFGAGVLGDLRTHFAGTILGWTLIADHAATLQIDVWKKAYADSSPPTVANTIVAADPPKLSAAESVSDGVLTGWSKTVSDGDAWRIHCDANDLATRFTLVIEVSETLAVDLS